ncbi:hypothetical protein, partial [Calothrix rhizosoleniae]|uniref:hypothetical protein n=1 Tax=Calothrix rhizosoleniae TaxID=888997 RepID=UPI0030DBC83C
MTQEASTEERIITVFAATILSRAGDWLDKIDKYIRPKLNTIIINALIENKIFIQDFYEYLNWLDEDSIRDILSWFPESLGVRIGLDAPTLKIKREAIFLADTLFNQSEDLKIV